MIRSLVDRLVPRAVQSAGSLLSATVINRATSFVVYAVVARAAGVVPFGHLALGMSIFMLFFRFTSWGLRPVVTRTLARPDPDARFFGRCVALVIAASGIGYLGLEAFLAVVGYSPAADAVIRTLYVGIPVYSISHLAESVFLTKDDTGLVPAISGPVNVIQTGVAVWLVTAGGFGVQAVAWSIVVAYGVTCALYLVALRRRYRLRLLTVDRDVIGLARGSGSFLGISVLNGMTSSVAILVVSMVVSEADVGVYAAASQLLAPVNLVSQAAAEAMYPRLVGRFDRSIEAGRRVLSQAAEGVIALVLPAATGLFVLARPILHLVYGGEGFDLSVVILRILAFSLLNNALAHVMGKMLWASDRERTSLMIAVVRVVLMVTVTYPLVLTMGVVGAAWAGLAVTTINTVQHYVPARRVVGPIHLTACFVRPGIASLVMAFAIWTVRSNVFVTVAVGTVVYAIVAGSIYRTSPGQMARRVPGAAVPVLAPTPDSEGDTA